MTILFFLVMWLFFVSAFSAAGVVFNTYSFSNINRSDITDIGQEKLYVDLDGGVNLTKVSVQGKSYFVSEEDIYGKEQIIIAYENAPAIRAGLKGAINEFDGKEIKNNKELLQYLIDKKPGDEVLIETSVDDSIREYKIKLAESPRNEGQAYIGITLVNTGGLSLLGRLRTKILFFKDPNTFYRARFMGDLMVFIYNLLWWIVLINFSVALVNMLPLGIFDGGRVFFLSVLAITKSEKIAKKAYKISTYLLLSIFLLLMVLWFVNFVVS